MSGAGYPNSPPLEPAHVHAPWLAPPDALAWPGVAIGRTYPAPIVDHAFARRRGLVGVDGDPRLDGYRSSRRASRQPEIRTMLGPDAIACPAPPVSLDNMFAGALLGAIYAQYQHGASAIGAVVGSSMAGAVLSRSSDRRLVATRGPCSGGCRFFRISPCAPALYVGILLSINELANRLASPEGRFVLINQIDMLFSVVLCVGGNLLFSVNDCLGPGVLFDFAAGRYHHPRRSRSGCRR